MAFLKPATVYPSRRLTCSVSHRYHLWDSKNIRDVLPSLQPLRVYPKDGPFGSTKTGHVDNIVLKSTKDSAVSCSSNWHSISKNSTQTRIQCVTHLAVCKQSTREEGTPASSSFLPRAVLRTSRCNVFASPLWRPASSQPREGRANERTAHSTTTGTGRHNRSQQAPLPERQSQRSSPKVRPLHRSRHSCSSSSARSDNDLSALPRDLASRPSSALCYDPATQTGCD